MVSNYFKCIDSVLSLSEKSVNEEIELGQEFQVGQPSVKLV